MNGIEQYGVQELSGAEMVGVNGGGIFDWVGDALDALGKAIVYDLLNSITEAFFGHAWF